MDSLVLELQRDALDPGMQVSDLLRKAFVLAKKLRLDDFLAWVETELRGYDPGADVPGYRRIGVEPMAHDVYLQWQPVVVLGEKGGELLSTWRSIHAVPKLEDVLSRRADAPIFFMYSPKQLALLRKWTEDPHASFSAHVDHSQIAGILSEVRHIILERTLRLEQKGILGEGIIFSEDDRRAATSDRTINIQNFHGVWGDVRGEQVQIGDYASIENELVGAGIQEADREQLRKLLGELKKAKGDEKRSVAKRGVKWTLKHWEKLGKVANTIVGWFGADSS